MTAWDLAVYIAGGILIVGPLVVFAIYLKEILRRVKEGDFGSSKAPKVKP